MKKLTFLLLVSMLASTAQAQSITHVFHYNNPVVSEHEGYQQIGFEDCLPKGQVGEPTLPWQSVSLILPQGQEAVAIDVEFSDFAEMEGSYLLYPYQQPRPYSNEKEIPFAKNESLYRSAVAYPAKCHSEVSTQYLNGVAFAFGGFTPLRYIPATGKVSYARTVTVNITTTTSRDDHSSKLWLTPENTASIKRLAQNSDVLGTYSHRGREMGGYDMLVITADEWTDRFGDYLDLYNSKGIRTRIVSLEEIYASMEGRDPQEQIRNYIIQEYDNNGIMMVTLGGDVSIVPFRYLWCFAQEGEEDNLPSDMYYACLDGTLNDDNDDKWGEVGEDDLLPELGIGRLPFNNDAQFETIMHKTFSYLQTPVLGEFTSPILGAEHLGDGYYGSDDMERLIGTNSDFDYTTHGYPTNYNFKKYYATPHKNWSSREFRMLIQTGGQYVHHVGHANTETVAGWENNGLNDNSFANNNGIDNNYMLFHSHGCICGDFSHNCILEKMVTLNTGFVATTGNSRYGWYVPWGDGMAAHIHREFVDAYCHDHIDMLGMALREAKIASAPYVTTPWGDEGCLRWNIYCLNVIGDGALCPWFSEPITPDVVYEAGLMIGSTSTTVNVNYLGNPLDNYRVSLYDGQDLLAHGITDANGNVELTLSSPLTASDELHLIITGQNAWPQDLDVETFSGDEPYIYGDIISLNGDAQSGSQWLSVAGDFFNKSNATAYNVHAEITTDCDYILVHESDFTIDEFGPNNTQHFEQMGNIDIADNIPDQTIFTLNLTTYVGDITHNTHKSFLAIAPNLAFESFVIDDSTEGDGNGFADPGEQFILQVNGKNIGHALSSDAFMTVSCDDERIVFETTNIAIGDVNPDSTFTAPLVISSDLDIPNGTVIHLNLSLHTGAYTTVYEYVIPIGLTQETFESGDFSYLNWRHSGEQHWFVTDEEAHTGSYSARSGAIDDDEISSLLIYVDTPVEGKLSFYLKTSTQYHHDYLILYIDNTFKKWWSGETDWTYISFDIPSGSHVIEWRYDKSPSQFAGSDCVWIDDISLPRSAIITKVEEVTTTKNASVYPNPCDGDCFISLEEESDITVFNLMGQRIMELRHVSGTQQIHLENASKGLYLIQIQDKDGIEVKKLSVK